MRANDRAPVLFLGHGSPMNAIEENEFTRRLGNLGREIGKPRAIVCISAHWLTKGTFVTHMQKPRTIHDFHGFPQALFDVQYPAPGSPEIADRIRATVSDPRIASDDSEWGLDHGTWSVLRHMYPEADVPILQVSIDYSRPAAYHLELGSKLRGLRDDGVLIVGSGNIVHNLRRIDWTGGVGAYDWATEFDEWVKAKVEQRDYRALAQAYDQKEAGKLSVPTPDHYYPLMYTLGASDAKDELKFDHEGIELGSISMRSVRLGGLS